MEKHPDPNVYYTCTRCRNLKPSSEFGIFYRSALKKYERRYECHACYKKYLNDPYVRRLKREEKQRNSQHLKTLKRDWYARNREDVLAKAAERYRTDKAFRESMKEYSRAYYQKNKHKKQQLKAALRFYDDAQ